MIADYKAKDIFQYFLKKNPGTDTTYAQFKAILSAFNKKTVEAVLAGEYVNLGNRLGRIYVKRVRRSHLKKVIDWGETMKLKREGIDKKVYFTDDYYYRFSWDKRSCQIKNKSVYKFQATKGPNGNTIKLAAFLKANELNKLNFVR